MGWYNSAMYINKSLSCVCFIFNTPKSEIDMEDIEQYTGIERGYQGELDLSVIP